MTVLLDDRFKLRRGTAADLATVNEVPFEGEIVYETDQGLTDGKYKIKIGDGVTHYNDLAYVSLGGGIESIVPGSGIDVDASDPKNPIVSSTLGSIALSGYPATYAALPTGLGPSDAGKAYLVAADGLIYIWNGTAWPASGSGVRLTSSTDTPPKVADFTSTVGSGCTFTDKVGRLDVSLPSTVFMHALYKTCPSPPYTIDAHVQLNIFGTGGGDAVAAGLAISDGTKVRGSYMGFWGTNVDRLSIDSWANSTTFTAQVNFSTPFKHFICADHYIRITDSGTTRIFWLSTDGKRFFQFYSEATNTYVTPTKVGLFFHNIGASGIYPAKVSILHFKITNSVLGDAP